MLKLKYLFEDFCLAKKALEFYDHDQENLDEMLSHFRISDNAVYPFTLDGNRYFARIKPASATKLDYIEGEIDFLCYLMANSFNCNKPVKSKEGKYVVSFEYNQEEYFCVVFENAEGECLEEGISPNNAFECGRILGKLHTLSSNYVPKVAQRYKVSDTFDFIFKQVKTFELPSLEAKAKQVFEDMEREDKGSVYGIVHGDFERDNVFYAKKKDMYTVIDFDDCMYCHFAYDLVRSLKDLSDIPSERRARKCKEQFLEGYRREFSAVDLSQRQFTLFDDYSMLLNLARISNTMSEQPDDEQLPRWYHVLVRKLVGLKTQLLNKLLPQNWREEYKSQQLQEDWEGDDQSQYDELDDDLKEFDLYDEKEEN